MGRTFSRFSGLVLAGLFTLGHAEAAIIDQGVTTLDTDTGLTWLDVDQTYRWSYDAVTSYLAGGGTFAGSSDWRYATIDEVSGLIGNFGLAEVPESGYGTPAVRDDVLMENMVSLLGPTQYTSQPNGSIRSEVRGVVDYLRFPGTSMESRWATLLVYDNAFNSYILHQDSSFSSSSTSSVGNFLVSGSISAVPVPAALPLFASALGMFGVFSSRRRRTTADS
ncbi:MAG: hypothetical protein ABW095_15285 [Candidatus Thiodiazotropha sp.]